MTKEQILGVLEKGLKKAKKDPHSFIARVQIANVFLLGSIEYMLTLWPGNQAELKEIEQIIVGFFWAGQEVSAHSRVSLKTLVRSKDFVGKGCFGVGGYVGRGRQAQGVGRFGIGKCSTERKGVL